MSAGLVERLRTEAAYERKHGIAGLADFYDEAADALEAARARIAERNGELQCALAILAERDAELASLRAELAAAREALILGYTPGSLQRAWDRVDSLPAIDFTESEEADLFDALKDQTDAA